MDEKPLPDELPLDYARRVARLKAEMGQLRLLELGLRDLPLLAADTAVALGKRILGKPVDCAHAKEMLEALSGQTHHVLTAIAVAAQIGIQVRVSQPWFGSAISANVKFAHISHMAKRKTRQVPTRFKDVRQFLYPLFRAATVAWWGCRFYGQHSCWKSMEYRFLPEMY